MEADTKRRDKLLSSKTEQKANLEVYKESGVCIHPACDLRFLKEGLLLCVCCGSTVKRTRDKKRLPPAEPLDLMSTIGKHVQHDLKDKFDCACQLLMLNENVIIPKCMIEYIKFAHRMGWVYARSSLWYKREDYAAYIFYRVLIEMEIYRTPYDVITCFCTNEKYFSEAEKSYCSETGADKIYVATEKYFDTVRAWIVLPYKLLEPIKELISKIDGPLFGHSAEHVMMTAIILMRDELDKNKLSHNIDLNRCSDTLRISDIKVMEEMKKGRFSARFQKEVSRALSMYKKSLVNPNIV